MTDANGDNVVYHRVAWVALGRAALERALPQAAQEPLGLGLMGAAVGYSWTAHEAEQFEEGLLLFGRDFPAIRKQFLPQRDTEHLVLYYYNVWKTQSTARAQQWYKRLEQVRNTRCLQNPADKQLFCSSNSFSAAPTACCRILQYLGYNCCSACQQLPYLQICWLSQQL